MSEPSSPEDAAQALFESEWLNTPEEWKAFAANLIRERDDVMRSITAQELKRRFGPTLKQINREFRKRQSYDAKVLKLQPLALQLVEQYEELMAFVGLENIGKSEERTTSPKDGAAEG